MGEFLPVLILLLIISSVSKITKKTTAKQPGRPAAPPQAQPRRAEPKKPAETPRAVQSPAQPRLPVEPVHRPEPLEAHMHTPAMGEEGTGTEGIDCCHDFMLSQPEETPTVDFLSLTEDSRQARAQALLQGVIFSEILGRRPIRPYGGKRP